MSFKFTSVNARNDSSDDTPEMVEAKGRAQAEVYEARAKLHWLSQWTLTFAEGLQGIGCILALGLAVILCISPLWGPTVINLLNK